MPRRAQRQHAATASHRFRPACATACSLCACATTYVRLPNLINEHQRFSHTREFVLPSSPIIVVRQWMERKKERTLSDDLRSVRLQTQGVVVTPKSCRMTCCVGFTPFIIACRFWRNNLRAHWRLLASDFRFEHCFA